MLRKKEKEESEKPLSMKKSPEIVVFHTNRRLRTKQPKSQSFSKIAEQSNSHESLVGEKFDMGNEGLNSKEVLKKIQFDVGSFGMKSFSKEKQREQERERAIKLGAKPRKKKNMNYRQYMEERKRLKDEADTKGYNEPMQKKRKKTTSSHSQPKFWKEGNRSLLPRVGKCKNGVLKLSSKDIKSISGRR